MLFNSYTFGVFLISVWLLYHRLPHRQQNILVLIASYIFYGCWDWRFLGLLFGSTVLDFTVAQLLARSEHFWQRRMFLLASVLPNLTMLAFCKYYNFFAHEMQTLLEVLGFGIMIPRLDIILPVGISFYTFQTMSYMIDVYRQEMEPQRDFLDFALYVAYFPQLIAGPIERGRQLLPQIVNPRLPIPNGFAAGLYCILLGLFKKIFVADSVAMIANGIFSAPVDQLTAIEVILGVYAFALQIYCDFSGYSLIAQGASKWLNIELMDNFHAPYLSTNPSEFWKRWHISLSQWLRDYIYIPLGGNRFGAWRTYLHLMITMTIGGLWHGANWTYVVWGVYHGLLLCVFRALSGLAKPTMESTHKPMLASWQRGIAAIAFFQLVCIGWLLFRASSMEQVVSMLSRLGSDWSLTPLALTMMGMLAFYGLPLIVYEAVVGTQTTPPRALNWHWLARALFYVILIELMVFFAAPTASQFIYFQF